MKNYYLKTNEQLNEMLNSDKFKPAMIYDKNNTLKRFNDIFINNSGTILLKKCPHFLHANAYECCWLVSKVSYDHGVNNVGYKLINLGGTLYTLHRIMASTWLKKPRGKDEVNHKDLNKRNNDVANLEWCTRSENMQHYRKNKKEHKNMKNYEELFDMYKSGDECLWDVLSGMTTEEMEQVIDDAQKHDFAGTYEFTMFVLNVMEVK